MAATGPDYSRKERHIGRSWSMKGVKVPVLQQREQAVCRADRHCLPVTIKPPSKASLRHRRRMLDSYLSGCDRAIARSSARTRSCRIGLEVVPLALSLAAQTTSQ